MGRLYVRLGLVALLLSGCGIRWHSGCPACDVIMGSAATARPMRVIVVEPRPPICFADDTGHIHCR